MPATYHGSKTIGGCFPTAVAAQASIDASVAVSLPKIQGQLTGALAAQAALIATPPTLAGNLAIAEQLVIGIQAAIAVGAPSVDARLTFLAAVIATLQAQVASLQAQVGFSASLGVTLSGAGVHLYSYEGTAGDFPNAIRSILIGGPPGIAPADQIFAVLPATSGPVSMSALRGFVGL